MNYNRFELKKNVRNGGKIGLKVQRFSSVRTCSPEFFWSSNLNLNSNQTLRSVREVQVQTEVQDRTLAMLAGNLPNVDFHF